MGNFTGEYAVPVPARLDESREQIRRGRNAMQTATLITRIEKGLAVDVKDQRVPVAHKSILVEWLSEYEPLKDRLAQLADESVFGQPTFGGVSFTATQDEAYQVQMNYTERALIGFTAPAQYEELGRLTIGTTEYVAILVSQDYLPSVDAATAVPFVRLVLALNARP